MSVRVLLLVPPSEGKAQGGTKSKKRDTFALALEPKREEIRRALGEALQMRTLDELSKLMKVRGPLFDRAYEATAAIVAGKAPFLPAWRRYSGVVWEHIEPHSLKPSQRERILIPSGLYGVTTAQDDVADYRLTMHVSLPGIGTVARYWRSPLTRALMEYRPHSVVVDLLPQEHSAAIDTIALAKHRSVVRVEFVRADGNGAAGHVAKAAKGNFARYLLDEGLDEAISFRWDGWRVTKSPTGFVLIAPN